MMNRFRTRRDEAPAEGPAGRSGADEFRARARAALALRDSVAARQSLLEGAAACLRVKDHPGAIALLEDAIALNANDLTAHQGLATAHGLTGDIDAACAAYGRCVDIAIAAHDLRGAWGEVRSARQKLGAQPAIVALEQRVTALMAASMAQPRAEAPASAPPPPMTAGATAESAAAAAALRATELLAARDPGAPAATVSAARDLLALNKLDSASDLLLGYIAAGYTDRSAQRLLLEVDRVIGQPDLVRDKERLLSTCYQLDGGMDFMGDVERLSASGS